MKRLSRWPGKRPLSWLMAVSAFAIAHPASAYDWVVDANVTSIEVTYMPDKVVFWINASAGTCSAGSLLSWLAKGADAAAKAANVQAVLTVLITAKVSGRPVRLLRQQYGMHGGFYPFPVTSCGG